MKKYAVTVESPFGKLWYYEENSPAEWWTSNKSRAMLFNSLKGAEVKATEIVARHPKLIGKVMLFEGEDADFRRAPTLGDLPRGPVGDVVGTIFKALFGGGHEQQQQPTQEASPNPPIEGGGGPQKPNRRRRGAP